MAVTALDWNSAAWSDLTGYTIGPAAEALRLALVERADAVGEAVPAILANPLASGGVAKATWGQAVDTLIDALIPQFTNTTIAAPFAAWSEATILTAIGAGSRLSVDGTGYLFRAAWAEQVRAILNKLLAYTIRLPRLNDGSLDDRDSGGTRTGTWAGAVSAYNAASWTAVPLDDNLSGINHIGDNFFGGYSVGRIRTTKHVTVPSGFPYDIYMEATTSAGFEGVDVWEDNDYSRTPGSWYIYVSSVGTGAVQDHVVGNFDPVTVSEPSVDSARGWLIWDPRYTDPDNPANPHVPFALVSPPFAYTT